MKEGIFLYKEITAYMFFFSLCFSYCSCCIKSMNQPKIETLILHERCGGQIRTTQMLLSREILEKPCPVN